MSQIAKAFENAARRVGKGLAEDFTKAYRSILKDTEHNAGKVAEHAAENEARTAEDLAKAAEKDAHAPEISAPHYGGVPRPRSGGRGPGPLGRRGRGRDQAREPHDAGREPFTICEGGEPVDMATGRMFMHHVDVSLPGALPLNFTRSFESGYQAGRWMGPRWVCPFDERLEIDAEGVVHLCPDRTVQAYPHPEPGDPVQATAGARRDLRIDAETGDYTVVDRSDGLIREFSTRPGGEEALLTGVRDLQGRRIDFTYDEDGAPTSITHFGGYRVLATVDDGRITALRLEGAAEGGHDALLVRYGYVDGHLTSVYNSSGRPMRYANDASGRILSWTDRAGTQYVYAYDQFGRVVDEGGPDGMLRFSFAYGEADPVTGVRVNTETDGLGHTTRYHVNERFQVVAKIDPLGNVTLLERDEYDHLLTDTDPLGRATRYEYDGAGDLTSVTRPNGGRMTVAYAGELSLATEVTYPGGAIWRQAHDDRGLRVSLTDPAGAVTRYTYDEAGFPRSVTDALGNTTQLVCNAAGLPVEITGPLGATTRYERDAFGRVTAETDPLGAVTRYAWDLEGNLVSRSRPGGGTETLGYDSDGNLLTYTDEMGQASTFEYGPFGVLAARTDTDGARIAFSYDANLRLAAVTNALGQQWTYTYDRAGRLISECDFNGRTVHYELDAAGQITSVTNPLGQRTNYTYDAAGYTTTRDADGRVSTFTYDTAGNLIHAANPDCTVQRTVSPLGNVLTETVNDRTTTCAWDAIGQRLQRTTPTGHISTWSYDPAGRPTTVTTPLRDIGFTYDHAGRELQRSIGGNLTLESTWDNQNRLIAEVLHARTPGRQAVLNRRSYTYRADGYLTAVDDLLGGPRAFDLDRAGRVTKVQAHAWTENYSYDVAGNLTQADWPATGRTKAALGPRTYSGTQLSTAGRVRYEYDAAGRTILRQISRLSRKPDTWRYTWNAENQLTEVTTPDGTRWRYLYDPFGRRVAKQRLAADGSGVEEQTDFTWDGHTLAEQTTRAPYLPGPHTLTWDHNGAQPLSQTESMTTLATSDSPQEHIDRRFFAIVTDLVGTPIELVDPTTETIAWRTTPTLWGNATWPRDSTTYTPLRFPGQYFDPETSLHYNVYRYYDPETARYTTPDPLGLAPAPNPDAYVPNPHSVSDPLGLKPVDESDVTWGGRVRYEPTGPGGRAEGMSAVLSKGMIGGATGPKYDPPGWVKGKGYNRAHLLAAVLGGSNKDPRNFVTMHQYANTPVMRDFELQIRDAVKNGEIVQYRVTPHYDGNSVIPKGVTLEAYGNKGFQFKPKGSVSGTNILSICNKPK